MWCDSRLKQIPCVVPDECAKLKQDLPIGEMRRASQSIFATVLADNRIHAAFTIVLNICGQQARPGGLLVTSSNKASALSRVIC